MNETLQDHGLEALGIAIAQLRLEIAELGPELKRLLAGQKKDTPSEKSSSENAPGDADSPIGGRSGFRHGLYEVAKQSEQFVKKLSQDIERHPMIAGAVAFGLGLVLLKLMFKRR